LGAAGTAFLLVTGVGPALAAGAAPGVEAAPSTKPADAEAMRIVKPPFDIWAVKLGNAATQIPERDIVSLACGTDGGPPSLPLKHVTDFATCPPEKSGLHEVTFKYDDEEEYIAKALGLDNPAMLAGTSMYAHPVIVSVLVDDKGIVRGIRVVTDDHASDYQRRTLFDLGNNLRQRYASWDLDCKDIPPAEGEEGIGRAFVHTICTGENKALGQRLRVESRYYRRKGETTIDPLTRRVVRGNFLSQTRFELVELPYAPLVPAADH
jgi:hypothetical protein